MSAPTNAGPDREPRARRGLMAWLAAMVPKGRAGRRLAVFSLVDSIGTGAFLSVSAIYFTRSIGLTVGAVAFGLSLSAAVGLATAIPVGVLADRYGARRILVIVSFWRAACFGVLPFVQGFTGFIIVMCLLGLVDKTAAPLTQALVGRAVEDSDRVGTMAIIRTLRNAGFTLGALMGSAALAVDARPAYVAVLLANGASFIVTAVIVGRLELRPAPEGQELRRKISLRALRDRPYLTLSVLNALLTMHMTLLGVGIPLWIAAQPHTPRTLIAPLFAVNTVLAVAFQVRASRGSETLTGAASRMRQAGFALGVCCALLALVPPVPQLAAIALLLLATIALTAGELFQAAGGWGLSYELAREGEQNAYLSVFWLGLSVQQIIAPLLVGYILTVGPVGWVGLGALLAVVGLVVPPVTRWAASTRQAELTDNHDPAKVATS
ncbi:MFS transporter [Actinoplanes sp. NPDC049118]|uniref:MFS transporter n=1 Tax=Actinoplanes sp. NPDC049118 TaxID=3155769 RepID=UPI0033D2035E